MNETIKEWLCKMYDAEIEEAKGAAQNEKLWALGSNDQKTSDMHYKNHLILTEYIDILLELKASATK